MATLPNHATRFRLTPCKLPRYLLSKVLPKVPSSTYSTNSTNPSVYPDDGSPAYANYSLIAQLRKLNDKHIKNTKEKNPPVSEEFTNAVLVNPYVKMLCGPIRKDRATLHTYPMAFLVKFNNAVEEASGKNWLVPSVAGVVGEIKAGESVWVGNRRCILSEIGSKKSGLKFMDSRPPHIRPDVLRYIYNLNALKLKSELQQLKEKLDKVPGCAKAANPVASKSDHFIVTQDGQPIKGLSMILTWNNNIGVVDQTCKTEEKVGEATPTVFLPLPDPSPEIGRLCLVDVVIPDSAASNTAKPCTTETPQFRVPCYPIDTLLGPEAITIGNGKPLALLCTQDTLDIAQLLWQIRLLLIDEPSTYASTKSSQKLA